MEVFPMIVLFKEKQPMHHLHFAEVAVKASTNDTWALNYASFSIPNTLKFFIKKEKKTQSSAKILCTFKSLWCLW